MLILHVVLKKIIILTAGIMLLVICTFAVKVFILANSEIILEDMGVKFLPFSKRIQGTIKVTGWDPLYQSFDKTWITVSVHPMGKKCTQKIPGGFSYFSYTDLVSVSPSNLLMVLDSESWNFLRRYTFDYFEEIEECLIELSSPSITGVTIEIFLDGKPQRLKKFISYPFQFNTWY